MIQWVDIFFSEINNNLKVHNSFRKQFLYQHIDLLLYITHTHKYIYIYKYMFGVWFKIETYENNVYLIKRMAAIHFAIIRRVRAS